MIEFVLDEGSVYEEYHYAQLQYKKAIGERDKDFWDGYTSAIEALFPEVVND